MEVSTETIVDSPIDSINPLSSLMSTVVNSPNSSSLFIKELSSLLLPVVEGYNISIVKSLLTTSIVGYSKFTHKCYNYYQLFLEKLPSMISSMAQQGSSLTTKQPLFRMLLINLPKTKKRTSL